MCNSPRSDRWVRRATLFSARSRFSSAICRSAAAASCLKGKNRNENVKKQLRLLAVILDQLVEPAGVVVETLPGLLDNESYFDGL